MNARKPTPVDASRRATLMRMGLGAAVAYAAPLLMKLGEAKASSFSARSAAPRRARRRAAPAPRPELVVSVADASSIGLIEAQGYQLLSRDTLDLIGNEIARFALPAGVTVEQALQQIATIAPDALADINHLYRPGELACGADSCAAFDMIGWTTAAHGCSADTALGMIDTSVNTGHEALAGVAIEAFSTIAEGRAPAGSVHGTAVAILIAGRGDSRTPGLLDGARVVAAEAFHRDAAGEDAADAFDIARAISQLAERELRVINLSFTGPDNRVLKRVVDAAIGKDIALVAAAGNAGRHSDPLFPAAYEGVVAVTAIDSDRNVYRHANAGTHIDFAAPGVRLWTAASISGGRFRSGTSYAAPFVSAALAVYRTRWPQDDAPSLVERLASGAVDLGEPGRDSTFGWGMVQPAEVCLADTDGTTEPAALRREN